MKLVKIIFPLIFICLLPIGCDNDNVDGPAWYIEFRNDSSENIDIEVDGSSGTYNWSLIPGESTGQEPLFDDETAPFTVTYAGGGTVSGSVTRTETIVITDGSWYVD